jgi:hypothetical protein
MYMLHMRSPIWKGAPWSWSKKKCLLFKHEQNNQTISNDWPTYCQTRILLTQLYVRVTILLTHGKHVKYNVNLNHKGLWKILSFHGSHIGLDDPHKKRKLCTGLYKNNPLTFAFILYIHVYVTYEISNMKRGGGKRRKPPTCHKSLTSFIT